MDWHVVGMPVHGILHGFGYFCYNRGAYGSILCVL